MQKGPETPKNYHCLLKMKRFAYYLSIVAGRALHCAAWSGMAWFCAKVCRNGYERDRGLQALEGGVHGSGTGNRSTIIGFAAALGADLIFAAQQGFKSMTNLRPDGEAGVYPAAGQAENWPVQIDLDTDPFATGLASDADWVTGLGARLMNLMPGKDSAKGH